MNRIRAALIAAGLLGMVYAVLGALTDPDLKPLGVLIFLVAVLIGHDVFWMAVVLLAGALITRFVPDRHRLTVRLFALAVAAVTLVSLPLLLGGRPADNPSILPLPYGRNLVLLLLVLVVVAGVTVGIRKNSERPGEGRSGGPDE
jgi:hypothetical protein